MTDSTDAKGKLPAFQFYTKDWREDLELQSCSLAAQGLWVNALCIAHQAKPYGHLVINGKPMTTQQIANAVGVSLGVCKKLLDELRDAGVSSISEAGAIFSRRMVRDQQRRDKLAEQGRENGHKGAEHGRKGAEFGKLGGRPRKAQPGEENGGEEPGQKPPQNPLPSSPSATPVSSSAPPSPPTPPSVVPSEAVAARVELVKRLKGAEIFPGQTDLLDKLVAAEVTWDEIEPLVAKALKADKPFQYLVGAVIGQRTRAAETVIPPKPVAAPATVASNPDIAATAARLRAEEQRAIAKPPAAVLALRSRGATGEPS